MKKNILKRVGLASLTIISAVSLSNTVNAHKLAKHIRIIISLMI